VAKTLAQGVGLGRRRRRRESPGGGESRSGARGRGGGGLFFCFFCVAGSSTRGGGGVRRCVREGETQAGEIKTYLTLGFGQGAARGGFMTMGCYAGRWGPEVRYPLLWLLLMTD
jgi:hypothetical protein